MWNVHGLERRTAIAKEGDLWCSGHGRDHPVAAFYTDARGEPYGPCKEYRRAERRRRDQERARELADLRRTIDALRVLVTSSTNGNRAGDVITGSPGRPG
jgi:hypothetical protein